MLGCLTLACESGSVGHRLLDSVYFIVFKSLCVALDGFHREGGQADGHVLGAVGLAGAVTNPLAAVRDDRLAGADVDDSAAMLDAQTGP